MAYRDSNACADVEETIRPQVATADVDGETVDLRGADSVLFAVTIGTITDDATDSTVTVEESADDSTWTDVADADILGTEPTLAADTAYQFGYIGSERYVRATFGLGTATNVAVATLAVRTNLHREPDGYNVESVI
jgi:hypothetical protein